LLVALGACRRVEEPVGPAPTHPPARGSEHALPTAVPVKLPSAAGPCVHASPEAPTRPAPPAGADPRCPPDPEAAPPVLRRARVRFVDAGDVVVDVEVAERDRDRMRGLMYRTALGEANGMLFVFEGRRTLRFWMRNTCLPLDMLFLDDDGLVVGIEENVPTMNDASYGVDCPSRYVLEVNAGWARRHGVRAGQHARLEGLF
jgi:uncharacterized membrane protein (UPF0127 family)